jgi:hypothetical protein
MTSNGSASTPADAVYSGTAVHHHDMQHPDMGTIGRSPALEDALNRLERVAPIDTTVLITGETGTGKELLARELHRRSRRAARPLVVANLAAIPEPLIASELFGHEQGAFTGANQRRFGRFEVADRGTLLLDEIGELSLEMQVALLRIIQERHAPDWKADPARSDGIFRLFLGRLRLTFDHQLIVDRKGAGHLAGLHAGNGLVAFVVDHPEQRHPTVLDDDVNRVIASRLHARKHRRAQRLESAAERVAMSPQHTTARRVPRQERVAIDLVIDSPPQFIVHRGDRQFLNLIRDLVDARRPLDGANGVRLQGRVVSVAHELDRAFVVIAKRQEIEHAIIGKLQQFFPNLFDGRLRVGRAGSGTDGT